MRLRRGNRYGVGPGARWGLAEQEPTVGNRCPQIGVLSRVDDVEPGGDDADRSALPLGREHARWATPSMPRARPDTTCTPASARSPADAPRRVATGGSGVARADDGHPSAAEKREVTLGEQHRRWLRVVEEGCRVARSTMGHDLDAELAHLPDTCAGSRASALRCQAARTPG